MPSIIGGIRLAEAVGTPEGVDLHQGWAQLWQITGMSGRAATLAPQLGFFFLLGDFVRPHRLRQKRRCHRADANCPPLLLWVFDEFPDYEGGKNPEIPYPVSGCSQRCSRLVKGLPWELTGQGRSVRLGRILHNAF